MQASRCLLLHGVLIIEEVLGLEELVALRQVDQEARVSLFGLFLR